MSYTDRKITQAEINAHHVQGATDYLIGNAQQNKAVFDDLPEFIAGKFNDLIDEIAGQHGDEIRVAVYEWLAEHPEATTTVQDNSLTTAKYVDGSVTPSKLDRAYSTPDDLASVNANLTNEINVLDARMDTFASLPDGSTSGNAELLDIRVGANGKTYPSAGDAVREQVANLEDDLEYLTVDLNHIELNNATYKGITFSSMGNTGSISGTSTDAFTLALGTFTPEIGKTYVFETNAEPVSSVWYLYLLGVNGSTTWYMTGETFTCTTDDVIDVRIYCPASTTINATVSPCIPEYPILTAKYLGSKIDSGLNQITDVNTEISEISSVLPHKEVIETVIDADTAGWETGYFYFGAVGSTITKSAYAQLACRIYGNVSRGDKFVVTARGIGSGYAIILCDSSGRVIEHFTSPSGDSYYDSAEYTASADGVVYLNTAIYNYLDGVKKYNLSKIELELAPIESSLNGVKWYSIGDSLNEFNATAEQNWIKYMIAGTGADNTNVAKSGSGFYRGSPLEGYTQTNYIKQLESVGSDAELITIAGSFNDLMPGPWSALPVGTASDTGTESIAGYMNTFFDALISQFPNVAIAVVITAPWDVFKPSVAVSDNYVGVLKTICEKHGIPFYSDCYYGCNLRPWNTANKTEYYTHSSGSVDGVHPNSKGHKFIYRMIRPFLEKVVHVAP